MFHLATDDELDVLRLAVDALTREQPSLIHTNKTYSTVVHELMGEVGYRRGKRELAEQHKRGDA